MPINYLKQIQLGKFNAGGFRISPSKALDAIIEGFYVFSREPKDNSQLIFNDGFPVLVFLQNCDDIVEVTGYTAPYKVKAAWASAGSIKNVYVNYNNTTDEIFIVRFHPGAFYKLFGLAAPYFRNLPIAPFEAIARDNQFDLKRFFKLDSITDKIDLVETYVQKSFKEVAAPEVLAKSLKYIHSNRGNVSVRNVSDDTGVNYKWLERTFTKNIGLLPKEYIQLQRFINAYQELLGTADVDLMRIAITNGYYDANHFLKDFKGYTGKTPSAYLKLQKDF
ncbi:MAG: helix-turn-helix domain-containing protein [Pedobacter sp.]